MESIEKPPLQLPQHRAQLVITLTLDGQVTVSGPINDLIACYGLLECAKNAITEQNKRGQLSPILRGLPRLNGAGR